jgi:hypothetical protein
LVDAGKEIVMTPASNFEPERVTVCPPNESVPAVAVKNLRVELTAFRLAVEAKLNGVVAPKLNTAESSTLTPELADTVLAKT